MSAITDYCEAYAGGDITFDQLRQLMRQVTPRLYGWDSDQYDYKGWPEDNPYSLEYTSAELDMMYHRRMIALDERSILFDELVAEPLPDHPIMDLNAPGPRLLLSRAIPGVSPGRNPDHEWTQLDAPLVNVSLESVRGLSFLADKFAAVADDWWLLNELGVPLVVVGFTGDLAFVGDAHVEWTGPGSPELAVEEVRVLPLTYVDSYPHILDEAIRVATVRRRRRFRRCKGCGQLTAPERRDGAECHACMEARGVVF